MKKLLLLALLCGYYSSHAQTSKPNNWRATATASQMNDSINAGVVRQRAAEAQLMHLLDEADEREAKYYHDLRRMRLRPDSMAVVYAAQDKARARAAQKKRVTKKPANKVKH